MLLWSYSISLFNIVMYVTNDAYVQCSYVWHYDYPQCLCLILLCMILQSFSTSMSNGVMYATMIIPDVYVQCFNVCYYGHPGCLCSMLSRMLLLWSPMSIFNGAMYITMIIPDVYAAMYFTMLQVEHFPYLRCPYQIITIAYTFTG